MCAWSPGTARRLGGYTFRLDTVGPQEETQLFISAGHADGDAASDSRGHALP